MADSDLRPDLRPAYSAWLNVHWNRHAPWYKLTQLSRDFLDERGVDYTTADVKMLNRHVHAITRRLHKEGKIEPYTQKTWRIP